MKLYGIKNISFASHKITQNETSQLKNALNNKEVILYDVDTTHGFMDQFIRTREDGTTDGFPVNGADKIIPALQKITDNFKGILPKVETVDAHSFSDPEMQVFKNISDIHCEKGTYGYEKIEETVFDEPDILIEIEPEKEDVPSSKQIRDIIDKKGIIRLEKNETSPIKYGDGITQEVYESKKGIEFFKNLRAAGTKIALLYGVATDFCVKDAAAACKRFGIKPIVIEDAVKEAISNTLEDDDNDVYKDVAKITSDELIDITKV